MTQYCIDLDHCCLQDVVALESEIQKLTIERDLLLEVVKHAEALIDNEANTTAQAWAICNSFRNALATYFLRHKREDVMR